MSVVKKFSKITVCDYPSNILKAYSGNARYKLALQSLIEKDYLALRCSLKHMDDFYGILTDSVERLDLEAVKLIVARAENSDRKYIKDGSYINQYLLRHLLDKNSEARFLQIENADKKRAEIFKVLLKSKETSNITLQELQKLADILPKEQFEGFCKSKDIDITCDKFKDLELSQYSLEGLTQLLKLENQTNNVINLLLSRTFSDQLTIEQVKEIYSNLYNLDPIAREMLVYTGALINQNHPIKIMFGGKEGSYYSPEQNIIKIDNHFIDEKVFNSESVAIHEIGHFVYDQLFQFEAMPFNTKPLIKFLQPVLKDTMNDQFLSMDDEFLSNELSFFYRIFRDQNKVGDFSKLSKHFFQYEAAARKPVDKAAELLHINKTEYSKYIFTQEYTEYVKQNSYIDVFFLNSAAAYSTEKKTEADTPDHVFDNIIKVYLSNHDYCTVDNPFSKMITREEIIRWAVEEFLPKIVTELNLSPKQIHFLERIADYINRGEHLLQERNHGINNDESEKYAELIVRAMELKAAKLGDDLTDSFKDLEQFHKQHISSVICNEIKESGMKYVDMNNEIFKCENTEGHNIDPDFEF